MESIQAHPYLNVCAQYKHGLGKSDDISNLTIGGRQECWQRRPGEIEEMNKEADSKKPFESVNELRGEKHKGNASTTVQGRPQATRPYETSCIIFTGGFITATEKLSEEMKLAIE